MQKYRLYLKRVSGVQTGSGGRGKASNEMMGMGGLEGHVYPPMMMGGVMGGQGLEMGAVGSMEAMSDQEELKLQLQMRHMQMEQAGRAERALKEEVGPSAPPPPFLSLLVQEFMSPFEPPPPFFENPYPPPYGLSCS